MKQNDSRRTTLTLPGESLDAAERIARERHLSLSAVVGEALQQGLQMEEQTRRSEAVWRAYSQAFGGFSQDELALLDGVVLEAPAQRQKVPKAAKSMTAGA